MIRTVIAILFVAQASASDTAPRAAVSAALADSCARKLDTLVDMKTRGDKGDKSAKSVVLTQDELNSYVNLTLGPHLPAGLTDVDVQLNRDRVQATAEVDIELVRKHVKDLSRWNPLSLMSGSVPVALSGRYVTAEDGFGRIEIEEVSAAGVPIPITLLEQMVLGATRNSRNPDGFDIHAPFRLPHPVRRIRLMPGRALLDL
jgi:hypothetical protein